MKLLKTASAFLCAAAFTTVFSGMAMAQAGNYNKKTIITFSAPVEIPGVHLKGYSVLPAGTYVFKLVDSQSDRHIVQISDASEKKVFATILAIPNTRLKVTDKTVITFRERPDGEPPALRAWFYPGDDWGDEFVYGKTRAKELASTNDSPVLYSPDETQQAEVTEIPTPAAINQTPVMAYNASGDELNLAQAVTPPAPVEMAQVAPAPMPVASPEPAELPHTSSPLGMITLGGLLSLAAALGIRFALQRSL